MISGYALCCAPYQQPWRACLGGREVGRVKEARILLAQWRACTNNPPGHRGAAGLLFVQVVKCPCASEPRENHQWRFTVVYASGRVSTQPPCGAKKRLPLFSAAVKSSGGEGLTCLPSLQDKRGRVSGWGGGLVMAWLRLLRSLCLVCVRACVSCFLSIYELGRDLIGNGLIFGLVRG